MTKPNNGGPAFPLPSASNPGMSLRDWFAGQALSALAANIRVDAMDQTRIRETNQAVQYAYEIADEALRVRLKDVEEE